MFCRGALWGPDAEGVEAAPTAQNRGAVGAKGMRSKEGVSPPQWDQKNCEFCCVKMTCLKAFLAHKY